jgi:energy-coupling factor transporter transmembrane protein EcfT
MLAAEKGAECLIMSALDTVPESEFAQMMPGLVAIFSRQGWMVLVWGVVFVAIGLAIQAIGLIKAGATPRWQSILLLIGIFVLGAPPDGLEIISLAGSVLISAALIPYGVQTILGGS